MKKLFILIFLFITSFTFSQNIQKIKMNDVLKMIDSSQTPVVINFWATWCHPCVEEIPVFMKNIETYKAQNARMIFVSVDFANDYNTRLIPFIQSHQMPDTVYWLDERNTLQIFQKLDRHWAGKIPATLMVNNAKHYREFYNYGLVQYQMEAYLKDLIIR